MGRIRRDGYIFALAGNFVFVVQAVPIIKVINEPDIFFFGCFVLKFARHFRFRPFAKQRPKTYVFVFLAVDDKRRFLQKRSLGAQGAFSDFKPDMTGSYLVCERQSGQVHFFADGKRKAGDIISFRQIFRNIPRKNNGFFLIAVQIKFLPSLRAALGEKFIRYVMPFPSVVFVKLGYSYEQISVSYWIIVSVD